MEEIKRTLGQYPSSFYVAETIATMSRENMEKVKQKLEIELESSEKEFSTEMEKLRVENLLSYLHFLLGEKELATMYNNKVLEKEKDSVIALSNRAWYSLRDRMKISQCKDICSRLKSIEKQNKLAFLTARAEVAFSYSRLGIRHYQKASSEFDKVLKECKMIEEVKNGCNSANMTAPIHVPIEYFCIWMYGRALCEQRQSNLYNMYDLADIEKHKHIQRISIDLLTNIIELEDSKNDCIKRYKARSYIELGLIAYSVNRSKSIFQNGIEEFIPLNSPLSMPTTDYFRKALEYYPDDVFVLERSGKYFRYINELELSIQVLIQAIRIKPTSFGYHHIALSFIRLLEFNRGALARQLQEIPLEYTDDTKTCTDLGTYKDTNRAFVDASASAIAGANFKHSTRYCGHYINMPFGEPNDKCIAEDNQTRLQQKKYNNESYKRYHRSKFTNRLPYGYWDDEGKSQEQFSNVQKGKTKEIAFCESEIQSGTKGWHSTCKLSDAAVDQLTDTFSRVDMNVQKGNAINFPVGEFYHRQDNRRRCFVAFPQRGQRHASRPHNRNTNRNFRNRGTYFNCGSKRSRDKVGIKCPKDPIAIDYSLHKPTVDRIITHLDRASEMSSNTSAIYDKALLYRQIGQPETALNILEDLLHNNSEFNTQIMHANIYEQSAFCINDILLKSASIDHEERKEMQEVRDFYFKSSIEISCALIDKMPSLDKCWKSAATLRNVLYDKLETERTKSTLKELWYIYKKLKDHSNAVEILKELQTLAEEDEEEKEFIEGIVEHQLSLENYEDAIIALCMSKNLRDGQTFVGKELYIKVYIEAGLHAFRGKHNQKGKMRMNEAFRFVRESKSINENIEKPIKAIRNTEGNESFDLFILSNLENDYNGRKLMMILNHLGLKTTFNTDSPAIIPGTPELLGMTNMMMKSNAFVILKDFDTNDTKMQHIVDRMQSIGEERQHKTLMLVVTLPESAEFDPGSIYATLQKITIDLNSVQEEPSLTVENILPEGVKSLILALASV